MKNRSLLLLLFLFITGIAKAQTTGSFNTNITFLGQPRQLSLYVPTTYTAANKYRLMICLHGLGDNSDNYRTALINGLGWNTVYPNTIIVCPEAAATGSDYYVPAGGEAIVQSSIDYAMTNYHIDTADVILQGFSLGGRAALRYGLDHPAGFRGLVLNTPAVQGVKEALNLSTNYSFNYSNAANLPPVFITHGETDELYTGAIDTTYGKLILGNCKVKLVRVPSMGHTIPTVSQADFLPHLADPGNAPYDLDIVSLAVPERTCNAAVTPTCVIRNSGKNNLTSAKIHYVYGATAGDYIWNGSLSKFQHAVVTLPAINLTTGAQNLAISVTQLNGTLSDTVTVNNQQTSSITYTTFGTALPINEGFESTTFPPAGWFLNESGERYSEVYRDDVVMKTGDASMGAFNTILIFDNAGRKEELLSPMLDLTSIATPKVSFDVAYAYHRYTAPYFTPDSNFADTLEVLISNDCGNSYTSLYKKGGAQLATFATPIMNPLSVTACFAEPADSNWRRETISLQPYATNNKAIVKFRYTSALGGSINIDNISFSNSSTGVSHQVVNDLKVFPNPANDHVSVMAGTAQINQVDLVDVAGKLLKSVTSTAKAGERIDLDVAGLSAGVYFIRIQTADGVKTERLTIAH